MTQIETLVRGFKFNRLRTLDFLDKIAKLDDPQAALAYRPAPGRAHVAWQLMHMGVSEEVFARALVPGEGPGKLADYVAQYRGGSTPQDDVPPLATIRQALEDARHDLLQALSGYTDERLNEVPEALKERGWTVLDLLHIVGWHEAHHQGQAHAVLNLYLASRP